RQATALTGTPSLAHPTKTAIKTMDTSRLTAETTLQSSIMTTKYRAMDNLGVPQSEYSGFTVHE
ncbi:MAG: hypothetical protein ACKPKO_17880, partial [Candidatus Fonsibacter sp.]